MERGRRYTAADVGREAKRRGIKQSPVPGIHVVFLHKISAIRSWGPWLRHVLQLASFDRRFTRFWPGHVCILNDVIHLCAQHLGSAEQMALPVAVVA